jgi:methyl-accepting chemotaxis protein
MAGFLAGNLEKLRIQMAEIDRKLSESNTTMQKFNNDYAEIDNIVSFLKNILNTMNVIGMMSRIESARDPEEFRQFMTISENIRKLQNHIHDNIPNIEKNIASTHDLIGNVNSYFESISLMFGSIARSSSGIIENLNRIISVSSESQNISQEIQDDSRTLVANVSSIRESLMNLSEIVKKPIEGSAANIERGKAVADICEQILRTEEKIS